MKKNVSLLFVILFLVIGCQQNELIRSHGISYLEKRAKLIYIKESNKNDTIKIFGQPSTKGMTNDNLWIYIERTKTRGSLLKLGRSYLKKNNVLVLEFDKYGVLTKKEFYDKNKMQKLTFAKTITENNIKKENFIYSFLSSIRQKMETKRK